MTKDDLRVGQTWRNRVTGAERKVIHVAAAGSGNSVAWREEDGAAGGGAADVFVGTHERVDDVRAAFLAMPTPIDGREVGPFTYFEVGWRAKTPNQILKEFGAMNKIIFECVAKRHEQDTRIRTNGKEGAVTFVFQCQDHGEHAIRFSNLTGPYIITPDESGSFRLFITNPADFDSFEVGKRYLLVEADNV